MHLTQQTDYALRVLIYAAINNERLVNIGEIAADYAISKSHLMKVTTALVKGGFLEGIRGKGGGLRLAAAAHEINIGAVVYGAGQQLPDYLRLPAGRDAGRCYARIFTTFGWF